MDVQQGHCDGRTMDWVQMEPALLDLLLYVKKRAQQLEMLVTRSSGPVIRIFTVRIDT